MKRLFLCAAACSLLISLWGCSRWSDAVIATVDERPITASELRALITMERGKYDRATLSQDANFDTFKHALLDKLIQEALFMNEAKRLGISPSEEDLKKMETQAGLMATRDGVAALKEEGIDPQRWRQAQEDRLIITKLIDQEFFSHIPVSDEEIGSYYKKHAGEFDQPVRFHARQILTDSKEAAERLLTALRNGEDFSELAKKHSMSPDAKRGGDLGFFDSRVYPTAFTEICKKLKPGETSGVVQTDYGFQIFQLIDKQDAKHIPVTEAADEIRSLIREERGSGEVENWAAGLRAKSRIVMNEEKLKEVRFEK